MPSVYENKVIRPVRVFTERLAFDGLLNISLGSRTLDELNLSGRAFLTLSSPSVFSGTWTPGDGPIAINKADILFVIELSDLGATLGKQSADPELHRFARAAVRLLVRDYTVEGYVYTVSGGEALGRLNQAGHPFLALNAATVIGGGSEFSTPFLAVNRSRVSAAQEILRVSAVLEEVATDQGDVPA